MQTNRLDRWVAYAELISAVVIILTLIYAVTEYRRGQVITDAEINNLLYEMMNDYNTVVLSNPELVDAEMAIIEGRELTPKERFIYRTAKSMMLNGWILAYDSHQSGILIGENWSSWNNFYAGSLASSPSWVWEFHKKNFSYTGFGDHVEKAIEDIRKK